MRSRAVRCCLAASRLAGGLAALLLACASAATACLDWTVPDGGEGQGRSSGAGSASGSSGTSGQGGAGATSATSGTSTTAATTGAAGSTTSGSGGGAPVVCDTLGACDPCASCAETGLCQDVVNACYNDPQCLAYEACIYQCTDALCLDDCDAAYPSGSQHWWPAAYCVDCDACPTTCADACASLG